MRGRRRALVFLGVTVLLAAACGGGETPPPATLPGEAVPGLEARVRALSAAELAEATPVPGLEAKLREWGLRAAGESEFTGRTQDLERVVSRTVEFESAEGASDYADLLRRQAARYLGARPTIEPIAIAGRHGYRLRPAPCGCGQARPELIAVVADGRRVTWLDVSGRGADEQLLQGLAERALEAAASA